jgi:hypothetical protein
MRLHDTTRVTTDHAERCVFRFTGGVINTVVVNLSGGRYVDHESQVRAWLSID